MLIVVVDKMYDMGVYADADYIHSYASYCDAEANVLWTDDATDGMRISPMGYNYKYQTPLLQPIQRNNPFNGIMI